MASGSGCGSGRELWSLWLAGARADALRLRIVVLHSALAYQSAGSYVRAWSGTWAWSFPPRCPPGRLSVISAAPLPRRLFEPVSNGPHIGERIRAHAIQPLDPEFERAFDLGVRWHGHENACRSRGVPQSDFSTSSRQRPRSVLVRCVYQITVGGGALLLRSALETDVGKD